MWQPPWHCHPFQRCRPNPSIGSPLGPHPGVLPCGGCGGCSPPVHPMRPQLSSCGPSGQWLPPGPGGWHPSNMMNPPGMNCDYHHPAVSGPPVAHGPPTMAFQSGAVNTHPRQDPVPNPTPSTPLQSSGTDISQLEERLGEAINKKFESMTETLKASMSTSMENTSTPATNISAKAPGSVIPSEPEPSVPSALDGTTATVPASVSLDAEPSDRPLMLTSKAKPPAQRPSRSTRIPSRQRSTPWRSRGRNLSPSSSSHRRSFHRRRAHPDRHHRGDHGSISPRSRHHDRLSPRITDQDASTNQTPSSGKDRSHPIYHRSNSMRTRTTTSGNSGYKQIHSDIIHQTVYSRSSRESHGRDSRCQQDRTTLSITLRSRSCSKRTHRSHQSFMDRRQGIHLYPRSQLESTSAMTPPTYTEPSQSGAESAQVPIPLLAAVDQPDGNRSSQERERNEDTEDGEDQLIPKPTTRSLEEDWKISVQKAFADPTRTKAPCEISEANTIKLVSNVSKRQYDSFVRILSNRNPTTPEEAIGNMASIFAHSSKMTRAQAEGSYTFEVPNALGYGLFVPTHFRNKEPFQNNDSHVYHVLHGTTNKGASLILAEELIRPGDFTISRNLANCGYPSYGFYSAGEVAAKTVHFSSSIRELTRKIFKIGKGTLPVFIGGIYTGRNQHINQMSGGNEEVQRLCGEHGAARGKEKYLVARSEHTTVHGVVITYKNAIRPVRHTPGS